LTEFVTAGSVDSPTDVDLQRVPEYLKISGAAYLRPAPDRRSRARRLAFSPVVAFVLTMPVNRRMISWRRGPAAVLRYHHVH